MFQNRFIYGLITYSDTNNKGEKAKELWIYSHQSHMNLKYLMT